PNPFQDTLRYAPLNLNLLKQSISHDVNKFPVVLIPNIVITCLDQLNSNGRFTPYVKYNKIHQGNQQELIQQIVATNKAFQQVFASHGPTRNDIKPVKLNR